MVFEQEYGIIHRNSSSAFQHSRVVGLQIQQQPHSLGFAVFFAFRCTRFIHQTVCCSISPILSGCDRLLSYLFENICDTKIVLGIEPKIRLKVSKMSEHWLSIMSKKQKKTFAVTRSERCIPIKLLYPINYWDYHG